MFLANIECTFVFDGVLQHSRPGYRQAPMVLRGFPENSKLCPVKTIEQYLNFRLKKCDDSSLFITATSPHKQCSSNTIARWVKTILESAGIDSRQCKVGSNVLCKTEWGVTKIVQSVSWTGTSTFNKNYDKEICENYKELKNDFEAAFLSDSI